MLEDEERVRVRVARRHARNTHAGRTDEQIYQRERWREMKRHGGRERAGRAVESACEREPERKREHIHMRIHDRERNALARVSTL